MIPFLFAAATVIAGIAVILAVELAVDSVLHYLARRGRPDTDREDPEVDL